MATALDLPKERLQEYIDALRKRPTPKQTLEQLEERELLLEQARSAAQMLKKKYAAERVFLFGSLAHQAWFASDSDIDLAVIGIEDGIWRAGADVELFFSGRRVDLVDWEMASESMKRTIERKGIEL